MDKSESYIKHKKYFSSYKPNDLFWGIGIENETYLEVPNKEKVDGSFFLNNHKRERYSVDYFLGYRDSYFLKAMNSIFNDGKTYNLPLLLNAHALTKCDLSGEHQTTYTTTPTPNPNFSGKTVFEYMKETDSYFKNEFENSYCFDGDTIEFMTLYYYKTTINKVVDELCHEKKTFLKHLNELPSFKHVHYPLQNHGFAKFTTNQNNLAIFNNGTYHFNFTLPTQLNEKCEIADMKKFIRNHKRGILCIQFFEPFFIAIYGSPDPLSQSNIYTHRFPKGSQRVAASRYIGGGTYDTEKMLTGKLLQEDRKTCLSSKPPYFWYNSLYRQIHYKMNDLIGFDINFNKFLNHGIEIRFFEWFDESLLNEVLEALVYILDYSQDKTPLHSPINSVVWNKLMYKAILYGKDMLITYDELTYIRSILKLKIKTLSLNVAIIFKEIINELRQTYKYNGACSKYMLEPPTNSVSSFCSLSWLRPKPKIQLK